MRHQIHRTEIHPSIDVLYTIRVEGGRLVILYPSADGRAVMAQPLGDAEPHEAHRLADPMHYEADVAELWGSDPRWELREIRLEWAGPGRYWLQDDLGREINLGECATPAEVAQAISQAILAGGSDDDWAGWWAGKEA